MKFDVTKNGLGTYEVKLNWESKDKIKKIIGYGSLAAASLAAGIYVANKTDIQIDTE